MGPGMVHTHHKVLASDGHRRSKQGAGREWAVGPGTHAFIGILVGVLWGFLG